MLKEDARWQLVKLLMKEEAIWESATPETLRQITKGSFECIVMMAEKMQELEDRIQGIEAVIRANELERIPKDKKEKKG